MSKLSPTLRARIKDASRAAAANRLRGRMEAASYNQVAVDSRVAEAERQGHGDEAFEAEMEGVQLAESQFSASKYDVPSRDPALHKYSRHRRNKKSAKRVTDNLGYYHRAGHMYEPRVLAQVKPKLVRRGKHGRTWLTARPSHHCTEKSCPFFAEHRSERFRRFKTKYGRDKQSARRRAKGRPLNPYSRFVKSHKGSGLTFSEIAKLWRKKKRAVTTPTRLKRHVTQHTRKGTKMTTRALPKELLDLARALREASAKEPSAAKASAIERKMESLIRQLRAAQKAQGSKTRREAEAEEIRAQAREWAAKGPSGDPGRRKKSGYQKFMKAAKAKGHSVKAARAAWHRLSDAAKKAWKTKKTRKSAKSHRDPGYGHAAHHRAHRARRHRGARRHHRPY